MSLILQPTDEVILELENWALVYDHYYYRCYIIEHSCSWIPGLIVEEVDSCGSPLGVSSLTSCHCGEPVPDNLKFVLFSIAS
jgi:hypothetical protein